MGSLQVGYLRFGKYPKFCSLSFVKASLTCAINFLFSLVLIKAYTFKYYQDVESENIDEVVDVATDEGVGVEEPRAGGRKALQSLHQVKEASGL